MYVYIYIFGIGTVYPRIRLHAIKCEVCQHFEFTVGANKASYPRIVPAHCPDSEGTMYNVLGEGR